jgi:hypothetical protein
MVELMGGKMMFFSTIWNVAVLEASMARIVS